MRVYRGHDANKTVSRKDAKGQRHKVLDVRQTEGTSDQVSDKLSSL